MSRIEQGSIKHLKAIADKDAEPMRNVAHRWDSLAKAANADFTEPGHKFLVFVVDTRDENSLGFFNSRDQDQDSKHGICELSFETAQEALGFAGECNMESATGDPKEAFLEAFVFKVDGAPLL